MCLILTAIKTFVFPDGKRDMSFDELYEQFFNLIQSETWKMKRKYPSLNQSEISQQFTIELWKAYEKYDAERGYCISTYLCHRFNKARGDLLRQNFLSVRAKNENGVASLDAKISDDFNDSYFQNQEFSTDENHLQQVAYQPDICLEEKDFFANLAKKLKNEEEIDLINVLIDKKGYSVNDYALRWNISRQAANKRCNALKEKLKKLLENEVYA